MPRTKGAYQKRNFLDTSLGRFIYLVEPIVFEILCPNLEYGYAPNIEIVIKICGAANNDSFKTKRFQSYVDEYIEYGLRVPRKKKITEDVVKHYEKIRNRRILKKI
jgi:hypothetical protein|tara:strand:+ start:165 stop:482 length:318 start_codon:yes stop_codon:yes gene_type:complete